MSLCVQGDSLPLTGARVNKHPQPEPARTIAPVSYSVEDAAEALGIGRTFAFHLIKEGKLKPCEAPEEHTCDKAQRGGSSRVSF